MSCTIKHVVLEMGLLLEQYLVVVQKYCELSHFPYVYRNGRTTKHACVVYMPAILNVVYHRYTTLAFDTTPPYRRISPVIWVHI